VDAALSVARARVEVAVGAALALLVLLAFVIRQQASPVKLKETPKRLLAAA
jgi:hypothetical protein